MYDPKSAEQVNELVFNVAQLAMDIIAGEIAHVENPTIRFLVSNRVAAYIFQANFKIAMGFGEEKMLVLTENSKLKTITE